MSDCSQVKLIKIEFRGCAGNKVPSTGDQGDYFLNLCLRIR